MGKAVTKQKVATKACTACGKEFPNTREFFHVSKGRVLHSQCKSCRNTQRTELKQRSSLAWPKTLGAPPEAYVEFMHWRAQPTKTVTATKAVETADAVVAALLACLKSA